MLASSSKLGGGGGGGVRRRRHPPEGGSIHIKGGFTLRLTLLPVFVGNTFRKQGMFMAQI